MNKGLHTFVLVPTQQIAEMPLQILTPPPPPLPTTLKKDKSPVSNSQKQ